MHAWLGMRTQRLLDQPDVYIRPDWTRLAEATGLRLLWAPATLSSASFSCLPEAFLAPEPPQIPLDPRPSPMSKAHQACFGG